MTARVPGHLVARTHTGELAETQEQLDALEQRVANLVTRIRDLEAANHRRWAVRLARWWRTHVARR